MEIEAKYAVNGPLSPDTVNQLDLAPYSLVPGEELEHHDIILDTPERAITGSRHALRLRDENGRKILTLKGPGSVNGGVHKRQEIEAPLPQDTTDAQHYDFTMWPSAIAAPVAQMAGLHPLGPLMEMRVHRRTWIVQRGERQVGELALDEGTIQARGKSAPVHELELELKDTGEERDLQALDARLRQMLPLAPESKSKLERGLALLNGVVEPEVEHEVEAGVEHTGNQSADLASQQPSDPVVEQTSDEQAALGAEPTAVQKAEQTDEQTEEHQADHKTEHKAMTGHTPLQLAARHAIKRYLFRLRKHEPKVREGEDPSDVHDMRVATRRIRAALQILEDAPGFDAKQLRRMRDQLRALSHELGAVRDLDVFLKRLAEYETQHPEASAGLGALRDELKRRRQDARDKLLRELGTAKLEHRLQLVEDFASQPVDISGEQRPMLVRHFAGGAIWRRYEDVLQFESELPDAPPPELHQLRIACKHLRYAIEMFDPALGEGAKPLSEALIAVQDHLGALQDTVVSLQTVEELRGGNPGNPGARNGRHNGHHHIHGNGHDISYDALDDEVDLGLAAYADALALRRDELIASFSPLWQRISDESFRRPLADLIAGL